jgi:hypothetical protein
MRGSIAVELVPMQVQGLQVCHAADELFQSSASELRDAHIIATQAQDLDATAEALQCLADGLTSVVTHGIVSEFQLG